MDVPDKLVKKLLSRWKQAKAHERLKDSKQTDRFEDVLTRLRRLFRVEQHTARLAARKKA